MSAEEKSLHCGGASEDERHQGNMNRACTNLTKASGLLLGKEGVRSTLPSGGSAGRGSHLPCCPLFLAQVLETSLCCVPCRAGSEVRQRRKLRILKTEGAAGQRGGRARSEASLVRSAFTRPAGHKARYLPGNQWECFSAILEMTKMFTPEN